jgi:hypothetical protein
MHKKYVLRVRLQRLATFALFFMAITFWSTLPEPGLILAREMAALAVWAVLSAFVARCPFCRGRFSWVRVPTGHCTYCGF